MYTKTRSSSFREMGFFHRKRPLYTKSPKEWAARVWGEKEAAARLVLQETSICKNCKLRDKLSYCKTRRLFTPACCIIRLLGIEYTSFIFFEKMPPAVLRF